MKLHTNKYVIVRLPGAFVLSYWVVLVLFGSIHPFIALKWRFCPLWDGIVIPNSCLKIEFSLSTPCLNVALTIVLTYIEHGEQEKSLIYQIRMSNPTLLALIVEPFSVRSNRIFQSWNVFIHVFIFPPLISLALLATTSLVGPFWESENKKKENKNKNKNKNKKT